MYISKLNNVLQKLETCIGQSFGCCGFYIGVLSDNRILRPQDGKEIIFFGEGFESAVVWAEITKPIKINDTGKGCNNEFIYNQEIDLYIKTDKAICANYDIDNITTCIVNCLAGCGVLINEIQPQTLINISNYRYLTTEQKQKMFEVSKDFNLLKFNLSLRELVEVTSNCSIKNCTLC